MDTPSLGHHLAIGDRRQLALYSDSGAVEPVPLQLQMAPPETCWTPSARMDRRSSTTYVRPQCSSQRPAWWRPPSDPFPGHPGAGTVELQHVRVRRANATNCICTACTHRLLQQATLFFQYHSCSSGHCRRYGRLHHLQAAGPKEAYLYGRA